MATTRYGRPTTVRPVVEEDTSQALVEGLINENISIKSFNLSNGIRIFIMVLKSFALVDNIEGPCREDKGRIQDVNDIEGPPTN
jgi:hypothetical protein